MIISGCVLYSLSWIWERSNGLGSFVRVGFCRLESLDASPVVSSTVDGFENQEATSLGFNVYVQYYSQYLSVDWPRNALKRPTKDVQWTADSGQWTGGIPTRFLRPLNPQDHRTDLRAEGGLIGSGFLDYCAFQTPQLRHQRVAE